MGLGTNEQTSKNSAKTGYSGRQSVFSILVVKGTGITRHN